MISTHLVLELARIVLAISAGLAALQYATIVGRTGVVQEWPVRVSLTGRGWRRRLRVTLTAEWRRGWPIRLLLVAGLGIILYAFFGQFKAMILNIPFDAVSIFGFAAFLTFNFASRWVLKERLVCGRS